MNIPAGSIILVRRDTFVAKSIRFFMHIHGKLTGKGSWPRYNHAEIALDKGRIIGAVSGGVRSRLLSMAIRYGGWTGYIVLAPVVPLTYIERAVLRHTAEHYEARHIKYQWAMAPQWIVNIFTGHWLAKDSDKRMFCYECCARMWDEIRPGMFDNTPEETDYFDLLNNLNFKQL